MLKSKLNRRVPAIKQKHSANSPPLVHVPSCGQPYPSSLPPVTSTVVTTEPGPSSQIILNSFTELLLPDNQTNSFIYFESKSFGQDSFELSRSTEAVTRNLLDNNINRENYTMIENKKSLFKKEINTEPRSEALYTVTSKSGNPIIKRTQRNRRRTTSTFGSLSRMPKVEKPENSKIFEDDSNSFSYSFSVKKQSKMTHTYGKSRNAISKRTSLFTGSLSDRLQLIDTTPTGEDPYQLGEADMREQSPIPKLMLQCSDGTGETTTTTSRRIYDPTVTDTKATNKVKLDRYNLPSTYVHPSEKKEEAKTLILEEPRVDIANTKPEIDWRMYMNYNPGNETSLFDFSYGENSNNSASSLPRSDNLLSDLGSMDIQDLFSPDPPLNLDSLNTVVYDPNAEKHSTDKCKKRGIRTSSLIDSNVLGGEVIDNKKVTGSKRGRKRAFSKTGLVKTMKRKTPQKVKIVDNPISNLIKGKAASPVPGMVTNKPYHTLVGDPDLSWYLGLDPDLKVEDIDQTAKNSKASTVEMNLRASNRRIVFEFDWNIPLQINKRNPRKSDRRKYGNLVQQPSGTVSSDTKYVNTADIEHHVQIVTTALTNCYGETCSITTQNSRPQIGQQW